MSYQQITVTLIVRDEDVESVKREFNLTLDAIGEETTIFETQVIAEECDEPDSEDLFDYEDAA